MRKKLVRYLKTSICVVLVASMLTGCGFQWNKWYFLDGNGGWKELVEEFKEEFREANSYADMIVGGDGNLDREVTQDKSTQNDSAAQGEESNSGSKDGKSPWGGAESKGFLADLSFDEFVEYMFQDAVNSDTMTLHFYLTDPEAYGITPGPVSIGTLEAVDREENQLVIEACREQLSRYEEEDLSREQQITMDLMNAYLDIAEKDMEFEYYYEPLSPGTGTHASVPYVFAEYTFYDRQDVEEYLELLTQLDDYFQSVVAWEEERAERGLFMKDSALDQILEECEVYLWDGKSEFFLQESFVERLDALEELLAEEAKQGGQQEALTEAEKEAYLSRHKEILQEDFTEAYQNLIDGMEKLRGKGVNEEGLSHLPQGQEYYEYLIQSNIGMTYESVDELYNALMMEITNIYFDMSEILYTGGDAVYSEWLEEVTEERSPEEILEVLEQCVKEDFPQLEESEYEIKKVSESMEGMMNPAFYMIPPIDAFDRNAIYINEKKLEESSYNLFAVLAHEGYPGHLYQNMYFNSMDYCNFRKILQFTGYSEGWGTYAEYYSYRWMEENSDSVNMLNCLSEQLNLAFSALLDVGIHYYGWSVEDTADFCEEMLGYGSEEREYVQEIYDYILYDPGAYLDYYVGYLEIRKMAEEAEETLGDAYEAKEFHTFILEFGPAPFTVMQPYFREWLSEQQSKNIGTGTFHAERPGSYICNIMIL